MLPETSSEISESFGRKLWKPTILRSEYYIELRIIGEKGAKKPSGL